MTLKQAIEQYTDSIEFIYMNHNWLILRAEESSSYVLATDTETGGQMYINKRQDVSVLQWDEITGAEYTIN